MSADGYLPSIVALRGAAMPDRNGFITALAIRALRRRGRPVPAAMLDAIARCRSAAGGFGFWPPGARPGWAPALPDDADDTAIMTAELLHAGRLTETAARAIACRRIARHRAARRLAAGPPWLCAGVFKTWHRPGVAPDLVDCTATANVLALFAMLGLLHLPGVAEARAMLAGALAWAGDDPERAAALSPFYPAPAEFVLALENAVAEGASDLAPLLAAARRTPWSDTAVVLSPDHPVCSSPYGFAVWRAPVLAGLRGP